MNRLQAGLAAAVVVGVLVALYPLYAENLTPLLWSPGERHEEEVIVVEGVVESVDPARGIVVVSGETVVFKGWWRIEGRPETLWYQDLLEMISVGQSIRVEGKASERWSLMAERVSFDNTVAVRE